MSYREYWSGVARRKLEDSGARFRGEGHAVAFELSHVSQNVLHSNPLRKELFFWDSVYTALTYPHDLTALRAGLQVYEYAGELGPRSDLTDAKLAVRTRLESIVRD